EKLATFETHFTTINGSVADTAKALNNLTGEMKEMRIEIIGVKHELDKYVPQTEELAADAVGTKLIAKTLERRRNEQASAWERWRGTVAWAAGLVVAALLVASFLVDHHL